MTGISPWYVRKVHCISEYFWFQLITAVYDDVSATTDVCERFQVHEWMCRDETSSVKYEQKKKKKHTLPVADTLHNIIIQYDQTAAVCGGLLHLSN